MSALIPMQVLILMNTLKTNTKRYLCNTRNRKKSWKHLLETARNIAVEYDDEKFLEDNDIPEDYVELKEKYDKLMKRSNELQVEFNKVEEYFTGMATLNKHEGVFIGESRRNPTSRRHAMSVVKLYQDFNEEVEEELHGETNFWNLLIKRYLEPLNEDKKKKEEIQKELISLRNKVTFVYLMINCLWIVATLTLQTFGGTLLIPIPKVNLHENNESTNGTTVEEMLRVPPLAFMFLIIFASMLVIQFIAMMYHRVYTLLHVISFGQSHTQGKTDGFENEAFESDNILNEEVPENSNAVNHSNRQSIPNFADSESDSETVW
uniref:Uncharacterized protein n=1 Tax=Eptatretus burgeri TaxID=7764 RepID=A0A8C4WWC1_EPTBU